MPYGFCAPEWKSGDLEGGGVSVLKSDLILLGGVSFWTERLE
jgi:hypothetical protein